MQDKIVYIQWLYGNVCNYSCSYCPTVLHSGKVRHNNAEQMETNMQYVVSSLRMLDREPAFAFVGGEPTLNPAMLPMLKKLGNRRLRNRLVTNGSAPISWWEEHYQYFHTVEISYHPDYADIDHIMEVIDYLTHEDRGDKINVDVAVHVTHNDDHWRKGVIAYERLSKQYFDIEPVWVYLKLLYSNFTKGTQYLPYKTYQMDYWHKSKGMKFNLTETMYTGNLKYDGVSRARHDFNREHIEKKQGNIKTDFNYHNFRCYAGEDTLVIDNKGEVWRGWCKVGGSLGNVNKRNVNWDPSYILCTKNYCRNGFDRQARKFKH